MALLSVCLIVATLSCISAQYSPAPINTAGQSLYVAPLSASTGTSGVKGTAFGWVSVNSTTNIITCNLTFSGLTGPVTAAHIHGAPSSSFVVPTVGVNDPILVALGVDNVNNVTFCPPNTTVTATTISLFNNLFSYFNIHTTANPSGEISGYLQPALNHFSARLSTSTSNGYTLNSYLAGNSSGGSLSGGGFGTVDIVLTPQVSSTGVASAAVSLSAFYYNLSSAYSAAYIVDANASPIITLTGSAISSAPYSNSGSIAAPSTANLTAQQVDWLYRGLLSVSIRSASLPNGEIQGFPLQSVFTNLPTSTNFSLSCVPFGSLGLYQSGCSLTDSFGLTNLYQSLYTDSACSTTPVLASSLYGSFADRGQLDLLNVTDLFDYAPYSSQIVSNNQTLLNSLVNPTCAACAGFTFTAGSVGSLGACSACAFTSPTIFLMTASVSPASLLGTTSGISTSARTLSLDSYRAASAYNPDHAALYSPSSFATTSVCSNPITAYNWAVPTTATPTTATPTTAAATTAAATSPYTYVPANVASQQLYIAQLSAVTNLTGVTGTGFGWLSYNPTTSVISCAISYTGLTGPVTNAHLHGSATSFVVPHANPNVNDGVLIQLLWDNVFNVSYCNNTVVNSQIAAALPNLFTYFNIHTAAYPSGEIFGYLQPALNHFSARLAPNIGNGYSLSNYLTGASSLQLDPLAGGFGYVDVTLTPSSTTTSLSLSGFFYNLTSNFSGATLTDPTGATIISLTGSTFATGSIGFANSGSLSASSSATLSAQQVDWLYRGFIYVNVKSNNNPSGEIKGYPLQAVFSNLPASSYFQTGCQSLSALSLYQSSCVSTDSYGLTTVYQTLFSDASCASTPTAATVTYGYFANRGAYSGKNYTDVIDVLSVSGQVVSASSTFITNYVVPTCQACATSTIAAGAVATVARCPACFVLYPSINLFTLAFPSSLLTTAATTTTRTLSADSFLMSPASSTDHTALSAAVSFSSVSTQCANPITAYSWAVKTANSASAISSMQSLLFSVLLSLLVAMVARHLD